jgi:hypothetical protein
VVDFYFVRKYLSDEKPKTVPIRLNLPEDQKRGLYANYLLVNFTQYEFRLHFAYISHPEKENEDAVADVVAKINIPIEMMPEVIKALEQNHEKFKQAQKMLKEKLGDANE